METTPATQLDGSPPNVHAGRRRGWKVKRRIRLVCRQIHMTSPPPLLQFMKYVVPSVLALVLLTYQGDPERLFRENPAPVWSFVASTCVYWLIVGAMKQIADINGVLVRVCIASATLSALSLLSSFLCYPTSLAPLLVWLPLAVVLLLPKACVWLCRGIKRGVERLPGWAGGLNNSTMEQSIVPV